jgi:hypothetical protein
MFSYEFLASDVGRIYRERLHDEADAWRRARDLHQAEQQSVSGLRKVIGSRMIRAGARVAGVADDDCYAGDSWAAAARA